MRPFVKLKKTGLDIKLVAYLNTYVGRFPSRDCVARHVWIADVLDNSYPNPMLSDEIAECCQLGKEAFDVLYQQKRIRMYHTKFVFEETPQWTKSH